VHQRGCGAAAQKNLSYFINLPRGASPNRNICLSVQTMFWDWERLTSGGDTRVNRPVVHSRLEFEWSYLYAGPCKRIWRGYCHSPASRNDSDRSRPRPVPFRHRTLQAPAVGFLHLMAKNSMLGKKLVREVYDFFSSFFLRSSSSFDILSSIETTPSLFSPPCAWLSCSFDTISNIVGSLSFFDSSDSLSAVDPV
jgi:hypothetical protein